MSNHNCWHYRRMTPEERFWCRVEKTPTCWLWTGPTRSRYGRFQINGSKVAAHRFAYELLKGPIPQGLYLDHTCHTPFCVNPEHLRPVTSKQNQENRLGARSDSTSGVLGVGWDPKYGGWQARVYHEGRTYYAGKFDSLDDAAAAVRAKRNELFTHNDTDRMQGNSHTITTRRTVTKTHCKHGHPFDEQNTMVLKTTGVRKCRACGRRSSREWHRRKLARVLG